MGVATEYDVADEKYRSSEKPPGADHYRPPCARRHRRGARRTSNDGTRRGIHCIGWCGIRGGGRRSARHGTRFNLLTADGELRVFTGKPLVIRVAETAPGVGARNYPDEVGLDGVVVPIYLGPMCG